MKYNMFIGLLIFGFFCSCQKSSNVSVYKEPDPTPYNLSVDFTRPTGSYTQADAVADFGNITGWDENNMSISTNSARVKLLKNSLSSACGIVANIDIPDASEYELSFKLKFHSGFDWSKGGKIGFGFRIGEGNTGCDRADDGNGGSARLMWYNSNGDIKLKPYIYYKDMPLDCGHDFGKKFPATGSIEKGVWYPVYIYVKSNTGSNTNGYVKYAINGDTILSAPIRWTTNDAQRLVNRLAFSTFRGGSSSDWESDTDGYIYLDDLKCTKVKD